MIHRLRYAALAGALGISLCGVGMNVGTCASLARAQTSPVVRWLRGDNQPIDAARESVPVSRRITNDDSLNRAGGFADSSDIEDVRVEIGDIGANVTIDSMVVESLDASAQVRDRQALRWTRGPNNAARSGFFRIVGDAIDREAEGTTDRTLRVALGDRIRVTVTTQLGASSAEIGVGRSAQEDGPTARRNARVRAVIMRGSTSGQAVIGRDDASAIEIVRKQIQGANEIWLQCFVSFGEPERAEIIVADPPPDALLAIADEDGLTAYGGGNIRLRANDTLIDAGVTRANATPIETATQIAQALKRAGFRAIATENPPTELGAGRSADVLVRDAHGKLVTLTAVDRNAVSTDRRQLITIGHVDLADGLSEFNNMTAAAGSLEERTLIKSLADDMPDTIDVFVVNRFTFGTRQGEAFIENGGGPIINAVVLDRIGLRQEHTAFTLPHELGHVLLNQPYHPDNVGPDAPWMLMDADSSAGTVTGPKRLTWDECHRVRAQSERRLPALLTRGDAAPPSPAAPTRAAKPRSR